MTIHYKQVGFHYGGPLEIVDSQYDPSHLGPNEILVKVAAAAINPIDFILYNSHKPFRFFSSRSSIIGFGHDFSGVVEAVGSGVTKFQNGDRISGMYEDIFKKFGSFSQYLVIDTTKNKNIGTIPQNLSMEQAAAFPLTFGTAYSALTYFKDPKKCERVLVIGGATVVGAFEIQLLKKVHRVNTVVSVNSGSSSERVKRYGADIIIDYTRGSVKSQVLQLVNDIGKFDLIIDCVGNSDFLHCMDQVLKPKAEGSGYTTVTGSSVGNYNLSFTQFLTWDNIKLALFPKNFGFVFIQIEEGTWYEYAKGLFENGVLEIPIDSVHDFAEFQEARSAIIHHKAKGKVIVKIHDI